MARIESDREDLMKEAVALVRRMEFDPSEITPQIIAGFRKTGWFSVYFGPNHMLQFDADGRLRRAYRDGLLYRTQGTTLARLRRERSETETSLLRHDLSAPMLEDFRIETREKIAWFAELLDQKRLIVTRQIPENNASLLGDIRQFLEVISNSTQFLAPAIQGKR